MLNLLKIELSNDSVQINLRVLRAMHDIGIYSYKYFENTPLEDSIGDIVKVLYNEIPSYEKLEPLGVDLGNGSPI